MRVWDEFFNRYASGAAFAFDVAATAACWRARWRSTASRVLEPTARAASIQEAQRFLRDPFKDSGVVIFSVSNHDSLSRKLVRTVRRLIGRPRYLKFLRHIMTVDEIKRDLADAGLATPTVSTSCCHTSCRRAW
jgi:hypothetical protein